MRSTVVNRVFNISSARQYTLLSIAPLSIHLHRLYVHASAVGCALLFSAVVAVCRPPAIVERSEACRTPQQAGLCHCTVATHASLILLTTAQSHLKPDITDTRHNMKIAGSVCYLTGCDNPGGIGKLSSCLITWHSVGTIDKTSKFLVHSQAMHSW